MADILQMIKETIEIIEETCSTDLIIYDIYGTFLKTESGCQFHAKGKHVTCPRCECNIASS